MKPLTPFLFLTLFMMFSARGQVIYVRSVSSGSNNGTSWANAYGSLQSALSAATSGKQIWVAKGTYKPTAGTDRTVSFQMKSGVKIYGGFAGTETLIGQRANYGPGETNETLLSDANNTTENRMATITVSSGAASQTITVTQTAGATSLSVSPSTIDLAATGGDTTITITSNTSWTVTSDENWLTIVPSSGSGNGTLTLTLEANPSSSARSATINVSGTGAASQTVVVTQPGTVGVLDNELAKIRVYPNPFSDGFYVDGFDQRTMVSLFAPDGRRIFRKEISSAGFIPTNGLNKGVYVVELNINTALLKMRIVKK